MARTIASLAVSINARTKGLRKGLRNASNMVGKFKSDVADLSGRLAKLGAGFAAAGAGAVAFGLQRTIRSMSDLAKTSDKLGIDPSPLIALRDAAQESGVEIRTFDMGLQRMLRRIQEASKGTGEAKQTLKDLGLNAQTLARLKPEDQFVAIAKAMGDAADEGLDLSRAMKLFDSEGVALINTLRLVNEKGLKGFVDGVKRSGRAVSRAELVPAESIEDRLKRVGDRIAGLFVRLAKAVGPSIDRMLKGLEMFLDSPELMAKVEKAFAAIGREIGKADQHLKSFLKKISEKANEVSNFLEDVKKITGAIGTVAGGAAAAVGVGADETAVTRLQRVLAGKPASSGIFDQSVDDAVRQLGDIPDRIKATKDELIDGALQWGRELRKSTSKFMDDLTGKNSGGFIRNESTGNVTGIGNAAAVEELRKINNVLKQGVGFGTNPAQLPPGTMIIQVQG